MERLPLETPLPTPPMNQLILTACNNRAYIQQQRSKACAALARAVERQKEFKQVLALIFNITWV